MKGQSLRDFKRLVSTQKMKSSSLWIASLVLRFKYISRIRCVHFHLYLSPPDTFFPPHYFSSPNIFQSCDPQPFWKPQLSLFHRRILLETNNCTFLRLSFVYLLNSFVLLLTHTEGAGYYKIEHIEGVKLLFWKLSFPSLPIPYPLV